MEWFTYAPILVTSMQHRSGTDLYRLPKSCVNGTNVFFVLDTMTDLWQLILDEASSWLRTVMHNKAVTTFFKYYLYSL